LIPPSAAFLFWGRLATVVPAPVPVSFDFNEASVKAQEVWFK